ncbi:hypothetical protein LR48_Vigan09g006400 [Vigna angularis]|uniref:Viral methyltransferase C-terminal domain-containing protein n=1 Tax=Phaseolus angularis TaxID=3914 RepID=A0A0L9V8J0_PHAAN|nr:hypothetical protein LR48_Vigan09g006400 [Vigna angularis]
MGVKMDESVKYLPLDMKNKVVFPMFDLDSRSGEIFFDEEILPRDFVHRALEYVCRLKDNQMTAETVMSYLASTNNAVIIGGSTRKVQEKVDPRKLPGITTTLLVYAEVQKRKQKVIIGKLRDRVKEEVVFGDLVKTMVARVFGKESLYQQAVKQFASWLKFMHGDTVVKIDDCAMFAEVNDTVKFWAERFGDEDFSLDFKALEEKAALYEEYERERRDMVNYVVSQRLNGAVIDAEEKKDETETKEVNKVKQWLEENSEKEVYQGKVLIDADRFSEYLKGDFFGQIDEKEKIKGRWFKELKKNFEKCVNKICGNDYVFLSYNDVQAIATDVKEEVDVVSDPKEVTEVESVITETETPTQEEFENLRILKGKEILVESCDIVFEIGESSSSGNDEDQEEKRPTWASMDEDSAVAEDFDEVEKDDMQKYLGPGKWGVNTIHESQGKTYDSVILVRLKATENEIYPSGRKSNPYIVVVPDVGEIQALQDLHDLAFPGNSTISTYFDGYEVATGGLTIYIDNLKINPHKQMKIWTETQCLEPVLRTAMPEKRQSGLVEMRAAGQGPSLFRFMRPLGVPPTFTKRSKGVQTATAGRGFYPDQTLPATPNTTRTAAATSPSSLGVGIGEETVVVEKVDGRGGLDRVYGLEEGRDRETLVTAGEGVGGVDVTVAGEAKRGGVGLAVQTDGGGVGADEVEIGWANKDEDDGCWW